MAKTRTEIAPEKTWEHLLQAGQGELLAAASLLLDEGADQRSTVRALSEAARGIELIIKALVAQLHWTLVFEDPAQASLKDLASGEFRSPSTEECLARLSRLAGITVDARGSQRLRSLRRARNAYEHFGQAGTTEALRGSMGSAMHVLIEILVSAENSPHVPVSLAEEVSELAQQLAGFDRFSQARMADIGERLRAEDSFECSKCSQRAGVLDEGVYCHFCLMRTGAEEAARYFVEMVLGVSAYELAKNGQDWPVFECVECEAAAVVQRIDRDGCFACFACAETWPGNELQRCVTCNRLVLVSDGSGMCSSCFSERMSRDD